MSRLNLLVLLFLGVAFSKNFAQVAHPDFHFPADGTEVHCQPDRWPFFHGVASGDPLPDAVILWTRVTAKPGEVVPVKWEMALDEHFIHIEAAGAVTTRQEQDFTVKIDVPGLVPGTQYFYRFEAFGKKSPTGRTKTAKHPIWQNPALLVNRANPQNRPLAYASPNEQVKLAVVSCNNYEAGYFNAFARIAEIPGLDAVLHLGDYIYEYAPGEYGDTSIRRFHLPKNELITIQDYRTRYAQYRLDPDLQEAHRLHPFICVWDDHEIANNAHSVGAQNHQPNEGDFNMRKHAATTAYYEWLPVRKGKTLYRQFSFGPIAELWMLDERLCDRDPQTKTKRARKLLEERSMMGAGQLDWLKNGLNNSSATWKIIGNQVLFAELNVMPVFPKIYLNFDAWDGYPAERQAVKDFLAEREISNVIFATGDTHASWCFDIPLNFKKYKKKRSCPVVAREVATPSVTSANFDEYKSEKTVRWVESVFSSPKVNPHLQYVDLRNHGYLLLTLTPYDALAEWRFVEKISQPCGGEFVGEKKVFKADFPVVIPSGQASVNDSR